MRAIARAGYGVWQLRPTEPGRRTNRRRARPEISAPTREVWVGVAFALPLFLSSMGRELRRAGMWGHQPWMNWLSSR